MNIRPATLAVASTSYLQQFVTLGPIGQKLAAVALLAIVAAINVRSTRNSADVQNWSTAIKVGALLVMSVVLVVARRAAPADPAPFWPASITPSLLSGMGLGMIGVLWAYEGWQYVTFSAGEAIDLIGAKVFAARHQALHLIEIGVVLALSTDDFSAHWLLPKL